MHHFILLLLICIPLKGITQSSNSNQSSYSKVQQLDQAIGDKDTKKIAETYLELGEAFFKEAKYAKAESCFQQALKYFESIHDKKNSSELLSKIALCQEKQNKKTEALKNYSTANELSNSVINQNNINRLSSTNITLQEDALKDNIKLYQANSKPEAAQQSYQQLAELQKEQKNFDDALQTLDQAYSNTTRPEDKIQISKQKAEIYIQNQQVSKALEEQKKVLNTSTDKNIQLKALEELGTLLEQNNQTAEAETTLKTTYLEALKYNNTLRAKDVVTALSQIYLKQNQHEKSLNLYQDFLSQLDSMVLKDSSIFDLKMRAFADDKFNKLQETMVLKDNIIKKNELIGSILGISSLILLILTGLIYWSYRRIKLKNKRIELQSLRREMNPHFIFNGLNSVNQFIAEHEELKANKFLSSYAKLMRTVMEHSSKDFIPLSKELELLQEYLALEHMRFPNAFQYTISIDEELDSSHLKVPNMILQPHLENAIWHGLRYLEHQGMLSLHVMLKEHTLELQIKDNGIGIAQSKALKTANQKQYTSIGLPNTVARIALLNAIYNTTITQTIVDLTAPEQGVVVTLNIPLNLC